MPRLRQPRERQRQKQKLPPKGGFFICHSVGFLQLRVLSFGLLQVRLSGSAFFQRLKNLYVAFIQRPLSQRAFGT